MGTPASEAVLRRLLEQARTLGFVGPADLDDQLAHARALGAAVPPGGRCIDLGSGGGLPALPVALAWSGSRWWLVESSARRSAFLEMAVADLQLGDRVEVLSAPAEEIGRGALRATADRVVARSFGPPAVTAECAAPLLLVGGLLVVSEPPGSAGERWVGLDQTDLGLVLTTVTGGSGSSFAVLEKQEATPDRYPRRATRKRPLF